MLKTGRIYRSWNRKCKQNQFVKKRIITNLFFPIVFPPYFSELSKTLRHIQTSFFLGNFLMFLFFSYSPGWVGNDRNLKHTSSNVIRWRFRGFLCELLSLIKANISLLFHSYHRKGVLMYVQALTNNWVPMSWSPVCNHSIISLETTPKTQYYKGTTHVQRYNGN